MAISDVQLILEKPNAASLGERLTVLVAVARFRILVTVGFHAVNETRIDHYAYQAEAFLYAPA